MDRRPYRLPRGGGVVGLDRRELDDAGGAVLALSNSLLAPQAPAIDEVSWTVRFRGAAEDEAWNWQLQGSPPVRLLQPVRITRASRKARHIPVTAFPMTNDDHIWLESGLEHDLLRKCDRDRTIKWFVSQPFRLSWLDPIPGRQTPDLLGIGADDQVTVWDARRLDQQDDDFKVKADVTRRCCEAVGWRYEVFSGLATNERLNLLWLHGFRRRPEWMPRNAALIRGLARGGDTALGDLFAHDDGSGELKSVVWHLVWGGQLDIDLASPITERSRVVVNEELWNV
jgi:hypothetical protein